MLTIEIGDVVGMTHRTGYTRDGDAVMQHHPHRAVQSEVAQFHFGAAGTVHTMRAYVVEYPGWFLWVTRCGQQHLRVDASGRCQQAMPYENETPWCHVCGSCELIAQKETEGELYRQRVAVWKAERERRRAV